MAFMDYKAKTESGIIDLSDLDDLNMIRVDDYHYHLLDGNESRHIKIIDIEGKRISLDIDGIQRVVELQDDYDVLVDKMGLSAVTTQKLSSVKAPMPGLVLEVLASAGQEIEDGDSLLILEAMKMENVLKASGSGVIKSIEVAQGEAVEKGQILIEME